MAVVNEATGRNACPTLAGDAEMAVVNKATGRSACPTLAGDAAMAVVNEATGKNACPTLKIEGSLEGLALTESNIEPNEGAAPGHPRSFAPPIPSHQFA